jgi:lipoate-protein ligase B
LFSSFEYFFIVPGLTQEAHVGQGGSGHQGAFVVQNADIRATIGARIQQPTTVHGLSTRNMYSFVS